MATSTALTRAAPHLPALQNAIAMWADSKTNPESDRRVDLLRDKTRAVGAAFSWIGKAPGKVTPLDVKAWQASMEDQGLASATVYSRICQLSSFYAWAMQDDNLKRGIPVNPVDLARPKAPAAYQNESAQALTDEEAAALLGVVKAKAESGDLAGKRDYALLLFYLATGMRRHEVLSLRWGDLRVNGGLSLTGKVKGGDWVGREVADGRVKDALLDYLTASGRRHTLTADAPLWIAHDFRSLDRGPTALTGQAFAYQVKRYAKAAGIVGRLHIHQLRHTFARMVSEDTGSLLQTQDALGHRNLATTRVYVQRIAVKKDRHSTSLLDRLGAH